MGIEELGTLQKVEIHYRHSGNNFFEAQDTNQVKQDNVAECQIPRGKFNKLCLEGALLAPPPHHHHLSLSLSLPLSPAGMHESVGYS